jgi:hypothetical protein
VPGHIHDNSAGDVSCDFYPKESARRYSGIIARKAPDRVLNVSGNRRLPDSPLFIRGGV